MLTPLWLAFGFLTRLPVPASPAQPPQPSQLAAAVAYFPVVGVVLGLASALCHAVLGATVDPLLLGVIVVALAAALTGGLHLDGLADVFDGLGGGRGDRARILEIMRDSRIGAHGATALVVCLLAKSFALATLCARGDVASLVVAPTCARFAVVALILLFPYARPEGLGRSFRDHVRPRHAAIAGAIAAAVLIGVGGARALAPAVAALAVAAAVGGWMRARVGGLTGDGYGAAIELAEVGFWVVAASGSPG